MNRSTALRHRLRFTKEIALTRDGADVMMTVPSTGQIFLLNAVAARIAESLVDGATRADIVRSILDAFKNADRSALDPGVVSGDVDRAIYDLAREGLLDHAAL